MCASVTKKRSSHKHRENTCCLWLLYRWGLLFSKTDGLFSSTLSLNRNEKLNAQPYWRHTAEQIAAQQAAQAQQENKHQIGRRPGAGHPPLVRSAQQCREISTHCLRQWHARRRYAQNSAGRHMRIPYSQSSITSRSATGETALRISSSISRSMRSVRMVRFSTDA